MSLTTVAFFNNKGGVGKTSLVYHLAWMFRELGLRVLTADLDPQANLTAALVDEERLEELVGTDDGQARHTVFGAVRPLLEGVGDVVPAHVEMIDDGLGLVPGDLALSQFEDELSAEWPKCLEGNVRAFRVVSAFWRLIEGAAARVDARLVLVDVGPNLGAINRSALITAQHVVVPLAPDLFSLQGLRNLGPTLRTWRRNWQLRLQQAPAGADLSLPEGRMSPAGYVVLQHAIRLDRPVQAYDRWIRRIPAVYRAAVLAEPEADAPPAPHEDPHCLDLVKHYRSLMAMAQEARKPMFLLKPADGALGGHAKAVLEAYRNFEHLARRIAEKARVPLAAPTPAIIE